MAKKTTHLKEIAFELNLSINTVSRALRDCSDISQKTKELVRQKAYELGYIPNTVSQFIKRDSNKLIAIIISNFNNLYFAAMCERFVTSLRKRSCDFTVICSRENKVSPNVIKQCISERVDGIICCFEPEDETVELAKYHSIPLVFLGEYCDLNKFPCVYADNELGGMIVANYLMSISQSDKYVFYGLENYYDSVARFKSFKKTIEETDPNYKVKFLDESVSTEKEIVDAIKNGYYDIFCFNDEAAYKLIGKLNKVIPNAIKVFPKLHVVGWDALWTKIDGLAELTAIDFDADRIVEESLNIIFETFIKGNKAKQRSVCVPVSLRTRTTY